LRIRNSVLVAVLSLGLPAGLTSEPALAQAAQPTAQELYASGMELYKAGELKQAQEILRAHGLNGQRDAFIATTSRPRGTSISSAVLLSLLTAGIAVLLCLPPGVWLGHVLARRQFAGKSFVELLVMLPLVIPPVVTGYLLLLLLGRGGVLGPTLEWLRIHIAFTWFGAAIAQAVVALPLLVLTLRVAIESVDQELEVAAQTLGASRWCVFWRVTLPLSWHGLAAGSVLAFARALGEFGATIIIAGNVEGRTRTLPLAIFTELNRPGEQSTVIGLVLVAIALACAALAVSRGVAGTVRFAIDMRPGGARKSKR